MAKASVKQKSLLSDLDRVRLEGQLDHFVAIHSAASTNSMSVEDRLAFVGQYIDTTEQNWKAANPGKSAAAFKANVLTKDGTLPKRFEAKLNKTISDDLKAFQGKRAAKATPAPTPADTTASAPAVETVSTTTMSDEQAVKAAIAANADAAQAVDAGVVNPEAKTDTAKNAKDADKQNSDLLRQHLTNVLREMNEQLPTDRVIPDDELNQLVMIYMNARREKIAKEKNEKITVKTDASALTPDGKLDAAVKADFEKELPAMRAHYAEVYAKTGTSVENQSSNSKQDQSSDPNQDQTDYIGKISDAELDAARSGKMSDFIPLSYGSLKMINAHFPGLGRHPGFKKAIAKCVAAENKHNKDHKLDEVVTEESWEAARLKDPEGRHQAAFETAAKEEISLFQTESRKATGMGFTAFKFEGDDLVLKAQDKVEYVVSKNGNVSMRHVIRKTGAIDAYRVAAATINLYSAPEGQPLRISVGAKGFLASTARTRHLDDMTIIGLCHLSKESKKPIELSYQFGKKKNQPIKFIDIKDLDPSAIKEMQGLGIDVTEALDHYNKQAAEKIEVTVENGMPIAPVQTKTPATAATGAANAMLRGASSTTQAPSDGGSPIVVNRLQKAQQQTATSAAPGVPTTKPATTPMPTPPQRRPGQNGMSPS